MLTYVSICSGIEAATVAWRPLGFEPIHFAEIDPLCSALLEHHYPEVPNLDDITQTHEWPNVAPAILVGGTPCQSFSVAGLRAGMDDPRGQLTLAYLAIARRYRPRWVVWENVPGVLSVDRGRALGAFLRGLGLLGYGWAYRVLDAQYFGLAQRRKRVFVVGYLGDWRRAAAVLFDRTSLSGHPAPRRETREGATYATAPSLTASGRGTERTAESTYITHPLRAGGFDASEDGTGRGTPLVPVHAFDARQSNVIQYGDQAGPLDTQGSSIGVLAFSVKDHGADAGPLSPTLRSGGHDKSHANGGVMPAIAFAQNQRDEVRTMDVAGALASEPGMKQQTYAQVGMQVRRLTPRECERLQGFPDDYTLIPYQGKPAADGPRYKALGNSMAVPVMRWIGRRIQVVDSL